VKCYDHVINSTDAVKYLGISIDKYLNCEHIVSSIVNKVNSRLNLLCRNAMCLDTRPRMTLTTALIQCYFDYSCSSWYCSLGKGMIQHITSSTNKVVRFVLDLEPRSRINGDIFDKVNMKSAN
jgi:hypothetical protein